MLPLKFCTVVCFQFMVARWLPVFQSGPKRVIIYRWEQAKNKSICTYTTDKKTQNWSCKQKQAHQAVGWTTWTTTLFYAWHFWAKEIFQHMTHLHSIYIYVFFRYFFQRFRHPLAVYFPHAWMKNLPARKYWPYKQRALQVLFCENTVAAWVIWELGMWKKHVWPQLFLDLCRCLVDTMADEKAKSLPTEWLAILSCDKERMAAKQIMEDQRPVEVIYIYLILFHLYFP